MMTSETPEPITPGAEIGALIGAGFGLMFLIINTTQFSTLGRTLVLALGVLAFLGIAVVAVRGLVQRRAAGPPAVDSRVDPTADSAVDSAPGSAPGSAPDSAPDQLRQSGFTRAYWIIVAIEAVALIVGSQLLSRFGYPELGVAWVSVVVGTHFYALGRVFGLDRFHVLATVVTLCGIGGFIAFFAAAPAFIPVISGVISGFVLLAFAMWALMPVDS